MEQADKLIAEALKGSTSTGIRRIAYMPYKMDIALDVVMRIGKTIDQNFIISEGISDTYRQLVRYFHGDPEFNGDLTKGILLMGPTGAGKTLAMKIMSIYRTIDDTRYVLNNKAYRMNYEVVEVTKIVNDFIDKSYDSLKIYMSRYVICLDDLGSENEIVRVFGNSIDVIGTILAERYSKRLLTFGTTNLPLTILEEKYDDRIISRMYSLFNFIEMKDKDHRRG